MKAPRAEAAQPPIPSRTQWGLVLLIIGAGVGSAFQIGKVPPSLTDLRGGLGLSLVTVGWVISIYNAVGALCGFAVGAASDWIGYRRAMLFGLVSIGLASLLGSVAPNGGVLLFSRLLEGLGYIISTVTAPALIFLITRPTDRGMAFGLWGCFMPLGTSAMVLGAPPLLAHFGWRGVWAFNGVLLLAYAAFFHRAMKAIRRPDGFTASRPSQLLRNIRLIVSKPGPVLLATIWPMYTTTFIVLMGFLPTMLMSRGYSRPVASALTALAVSVNMLGNMTAGWLLKHGAKRWALIAFSASVSGISMLGVYHPAAPEWLRYALCLTYSVCGGFTPVCVLGGAPVYAPDPTLVATTNGFINQCSYIGMMIGPPAAAALATASGGWQNTPWLLTTGACVGVVCALVLRKIPPTNEG